MEKLIGNVSLIIKGKKVSIVADTDLGPVVLLSTLLSEKKDKSGLRGAGFAIRNDGKFEKWVPQVDGIAIDLANKLWVTSKEEAPTSEDSEPELEV